ncbi:hypothetical protein F2Q69_00041749 [Brassica cretica]|uniref:Uncharacterized protein n=1 Tax=Brassica cretica TaxID=69181 RepID=A0A8S9NMK8_BRACR|nr:hypothetical protein F2Q69_00041749 [Brassica cretica]
MARSDLILSIESPSKGNFPFSLDQPESSLFPWLLAISISSFSYHASSPTLSFKLETEYREDPSLKLAMVLSIFLLPSTSAGSLHDQLAMVLAMVTKPPWTELQVTSPLSQHPLYPLWSRLRTSPQNVGNKVHLSIVTTSSLPSLEQAADFSTECWQ